LPGTLSSWIPDPKRAAALAKAAGGGSVASSYTDVLGSIDGAIVTAPHHLHREIAGALLEAGVPVLSEKPLAGNADDARAIIEIAERAGVPLAVNNTRRLFPSNRRVATLLAEGAIGAVQRIEIEDGDKFDWPLASPSLFGPAGGGRGILLDIGAHVLDLVCWWMGGLPDVERCEDDAMGGTEAWASVAMRRGTTTARVKLSWHSKLANRYEVIGEHGSLSGGIYDWQTLTQTAGGRSRVLKLGAEARLYNDFAHEMLENFVSVVSTGAPPLISGRDVLPSLELMDACYARRERVAMPWYDAWQRVVA
jgi:predicted dehydrogenase